MYFATMLGTSSVKAQRLITSLSPLPVSAPSVAAEAPLSALFPAVAVVEPYSLVDVDVQPVASAAIIASERTLAITFFIKFPPYECVNYESADSICIVMLSKISQSFLTYLATLCTFIANFAICWTLFAHFALYHLFVRLSCYNELSIISGDQYI